MDAVETAVAEDADDLTGFGGFGELVDDGVGGGEVERGFAGVLQVGDEALGIEAFFGAELVEARDLRDGDAVGEGEGVGEFSLEDVAASRV